ncbi:MAG: MFS transporter [Verrucomicrobia bacterium]|nr:MFS transporter [Verrucomicrobiota bacterium]MCF7709457.1 MFS transporter [Verrucomicrobiota bacterium]
MKRPSVIIIFLTVFFDLIGFGIVMPLLPLYSEKFGASGFELGLIIASFSIMQLFFSPIWGRISDRIGRRPVLLLSISGGVLAYIIFSIASMISGKTGMWLLLASRSFAGMCGGNINVAQAYIADISPPKDRSARMGLIGMAFSLGFILGPALGAFSAKWGLSAPGWVAAGICSTNLILAFFILPESRRGGSSKAPQPPTLVQWIQTLKHSNIRLLIILFFLATFSFTCFETTLALLAQRMFDFDRQHVGYLFTFTGVISAIIQGGLIRRLVYYFGEPKLIFLSFITLGIGLACLPHMGKLPLFLLALGIMAVGSSTNRPPLFGMVSLYSPADEQASVLGVAQSAGSLARIVGPVFASTLFIQFRPALPYWICGGIALFSAFLARRYLIDPKARRS